MSDIMEKLLQDEQDTDAKFVAAANFFVGLKDKTKEATTAKAKNVKVKKVRSAAAADVKGIVAKGGAKSIPMKASKITKAPTIKGQARPSDSRGSGGYAKVPTGETKLKLPAKLPRAEKKKVKVVIASALAEGLVKEALILNWLKGARSVAGQGAKTVNEAVEQGTKKAVESGKEFKAGFGAEPGTVLGNMASNVRNVFTRGPAKERIKNVPTTWVGSKVQGVKNLWRNPALIERERKVGERIAKWEAKNAKPVGDAATPEALRAWTTKYNDMVRGQRGKLNTYKSGMDARNVTGLPETANSVLSKIRAPDGSYSINSVMKGAEDMGLFNPETLMGLGMTAKASRDAARAAKAAADKDRMLKWGLGGAAGLTGLALLKRPKNDART